MKKHFLFILSCFLLLLPVTSCKKNSEFQDSNINVGMGNELINKNKKEEKKLMKEAKLIERAGAFSIVLECISPNVAKKITENLQISTIGIGSSSNCDGQILVTDDILGISGFYPKFIKRYVELNRIIEKAVKKYTRDVKLNKFPTKKNFLDGSKLRK